MDNEPNRELRGPIKHLLTVFGPAIEALQLLSKVDKTVMRITTQFPEIFTRLGKMKGEYHIQLTEEVHIVHYLLQNPRHVPKPLLPKVKLN